MDFVERGKLLTKLRKLVPGQRVAYTCWRGGKGEGVFLRFVDSKGTEVQASRWRAASDKEALVVRRDFSADDGRVFRPFADDGDSIVSLNPLDICETIHES